MLIIRKLILSISNLKFAIFLILFIAISSGIGTLIPQGNNKQEYIDFYNIKPIFGFIDGNNILLLQLDHIYTSAWFLFLLILLCLSLAACSFRRQIPSLKTSLKWKKYDNEEKFSNLQLVSNWKTLDNKKLILKSNDLLLKKGWKISSHKNSLSARKGLIGKLGPIIVHIGLIILLIGSAYGSLTSQSKEEFLIIDEVLELINESNNSNLSVKLKDFFIERESDGKPKQFISSLDFYSKNSNEVKTKITKVNHPIRYKGITIYQADWSISKILLQIDDILYQLQLKPVPEIGDQIWGVVIELGKNIKENYLLTIDNENGPIKVFDTKNFSETDIYLNNDPVKISSSNISLEKIIPSSGLIIKNDPSIPFIYFAFLLIMLGTLLSLIPTNQIWIFLKEDTNNLFIGGMSNRNLPGFKKDFLELTNEIKNF